MVNSVLALLKMEVRELIREANMTDSIRPRKPKTQTRQRKEIKS